MQVVQVSDMVGGWFIGDFTPSVLRTKGFEVGYKEHPKGENWPSHYHTGEEYTLVISGSMRICGKVVGAGDIIFIEPMEVAAPEFLEDCRLVTIKVPSIPGDKYITEAP